MFTNATDTITHLKKKIEIKLNITYKDQLLMYNRIELDNNKPIE